jgi:hypothetical protein
MLGLYRQCRCAVKAALYGSEKTGAASRIQGLIAVNEFVPWFKAWRRNRED